MRISFTYRLSIQHWLRHRLQVGLISLVVVTACRVYMILYGVFYIDFQAMMAILHRYGQQLRLPQELIFVVVILVIIFGSSRRYELVIQTGSTYFPCQIRDSNICLIIGRMIILVEGVPSVSWLASWIQLVFLTKLGLQGFLIIVEILIIGLKSVPIMGLLAFQLIQIILIEI